MSVKIRTGVHFEKNIKRIVAETLKVAEDRVVPSANFVDDLGADSLNQVELIMAFEDAFDIEIPDEDAMEIKTVVNASNYIMGKI